jgi:hypothetical protein
MNNHGDAQIQKVTHINESIPSRWAGTRYALLLAIGLNGTEALCADGLLVRHRAKIRGEFCNQITSQCPVIVIVAAVIVVRRSGRGRCRCRCRCGRGRRCWSWRVIPLIKSSRLEREGCRDTRAAFPWAIQVLERDNGGRDAVLLVLNGVTKGEIDLDRGVVERMTELGVAGQGLGA